MTKIAKSLTELIGRTPMLDLSRYTRAVVPGARIVAKLESFNPGGSVKDRIALSMIQDAKNSGMLAEGGTIIEPTSGNTGIGVAWVATAMGYKAVIVMPETMSVERRQLVAALGATLVLTPGGEGMKGAIVRAQQLCDEIPGSVVLDQFDNPSNPKVHETSTVAEIWEDTGGDVDILVAGVGTGGTISGTGRGLKRLKPSVEVVAVEPADSPVLSGGDPGPHGIQGIGAGFVPGEYDHSVVDRVMAVETDRACEAARRLAVTEGLLTGISSGAALSAATELAADPRNHGKTIVVILPDTGERYLSTALFDACK